MRMAKEGFIETGVDKLVKLVESKKKISTTEAAKALGVSVAVIDEWADFLEEEGLISIDYKLATTYLQERKLSKKEVLKKAKEFHGSKDAFVRKVETAAHGIEKETQGLDDLKEQFTKLKKEIGDDLSNVKDELKQLENYEKLKQGIDKQIEDQQKEFKDKIAEMDNELSKEQKKYKKVMDDIDLEKVKLQEEESQVSSLKEQERLLLKKIEEINQTLKTIKKNIYEEEEKSKVAEDHIKYLEKMADKAMEHIKQQKQGIKPLIEESRQQEENILKMQERVYKKVAEGHAHISSEVKESENLAKRFKSFFSKKNKIEKLLQTIDKDKEQMEDELRDLVKKAHAFDLASKSSDVKKHITELEKTFKDIEKKRNTFRGELDQLVKLIKTSL